MHGAKMGEGVGVGCFSLGFRGCGGSSEEVGGLTYGYCALPDGNDLQMRMREFCCGWRSFGSCFARPQKRDLGHPAASLKRGKLKKAWYDSKDSTTAKGQLAG